MPIARASCLHALAQNVMVWRHNAAHNVSLILLLGVQPNPHYGRRPAIWLHRERGSQRNGNLRERNQFSFLRFFQGRRSKFRHFFLWRWDGKPRPECGKVFFFRRNSFESKVLILTLLWTSTPAFIVITNFLETLWSLITVFILF